MRENDEATILWDGPVKTDKEIKANRPDILKMDKIERVYSLTYWFPPQKKPP